MPKVVELTVPNRVTRSLRNRLVSVDSENSRSSTPVSELSPISEKEKKQTSTSSSSPKARTTRKDVTTPAKAVSRSRRASLSEADIRPVPSPARRKIRGSSIASEDEAATPTRTRSRKSPLIIDSPIIEENGSPGKGNLSKKRGRPRKDTKDEENNQEARKSDLSLRSKDRNSSIIESDIVINLDSDEEKIKSPKRVSSETKNVQSSDEKKGSKKMMVKLKQMNTKNIMQEHEGNDTNNETIKREVDDVNKKKTKVQKENKEEGFKDLCSDDVEIESETIKSAKNASKEILSSSKEKKADKTVDENEKDKKENSPKENKIEIPTLKNQKKKDRDDSKNMKKNEVLNQEEKEDKYVTEDQGSDEVYIEKFETETVDLKATEISIEEKKTAKAIKELIDKDTDLEIEKGVENSDVDTIDKEQKDNARQGKNEGSEHVVEKQLEEKNNRTEKVDNAEEDAEIDTQEKDSVVKIMSIEVIAKGGLIEAEKRDDEHDVKKETLDKEEAKMANFNAVKNKNKHNDIQNQEDEDILTSQKENEKQEKELQSIKYKEQEDVEKLESVLEEEIACNDASISNTNFNSNIDPEETDVNPNPEKSVEMEDIEIHNISMNKTDREDVSVLSNITEDQDFGDNAMDSESKDLKKDGQHNINNSQEVQNKTLQEISDSYFTEQSEKNTTKDNADKDKSKKQKSVTFGTDNTDKKSINYPKTPLIMKGKSNIDSRSLSLRCLDTSTDTSTDISTLSKKSDENSQEKSNHKKMDENLFPDSDTPYKGLRGKSSLSSSTPIATLKNQLEVGDENVGTLKQDKNTLSNSIGENSSTNEAESTISNEDLKISAESDNLKATTNSSVNNDNESKNTEYGFAKTWNQSVTVNVADDTNKGKYIDGYGLKTDSKKEVKKIQSSGKKNVSDCVLLSDLENYEESDSDHENRNEFIDDEAEEAEEENSLCSEERAYLEENEVPVDGISIGSEDTDADNEEEEDESDSFVISDNEEDTELLSYDEEEVFSNSDDSAVKQKKRRKRAIFLVSSSDEETDANDSKQDVNDSVKKLRNKKEKNSSDTSNTEINAKIATISNNKNRKSKDRFETDSFNQKKPNPKKRARHLATSSDEECNDNTPNAHNINKNMEAINEGNKTIVNTNNSTKSDNESYESDEMLSSSDNNADNVQKKETKKRSCILISSDDEEKCEKDIVGLNTVASEKIDVKNVTLRDKINVLEPISEDNETFDINNDTENVNECISTDLNADGNTIKDPKSARRSESEHQSSPDDHQISLKASSSTSQKSPEKEKDGDDSNLLEVSAQKDEDQILQNSEAVNQPSTTQGENSLDENEQKKELTAKEDCTKKEANRKLSFSSEQESGSVSNTSANLLASATNLPDNTPIFNINETLNVAETSIRNSQESELLEGVVAKKTSSVCTSVSNTSVNLLASATNQHDNTPIFNINETRNGAETSIRKSQESELLEGIVTKKTSSLCTSVSNTSANLLASATNQHDNTPILNINETLNIAETSIRKPKESELLVDVATKETSSVCISKKIRKSQGSPAKNRSQDIQNDFTSDKDTIPNKAGSLKSIDKTGKTTNIEEKLEEQACLEQSFNYMKISSSNEELEKAEKTVNNILNEEGGATSLEVNEKDSDVKTKSSFKNKSLDLPRKRKLSTEQKVLSSSFNCLINDKAQDSSSEDSNSEEEPFIEKKEAIAKAVKYAAFLLNKQIEELSMAKSELEKKKANDECKFGFLQQESTYAVCSDKQKSRLLPDSILEALDDGPINKSKKQRLNETEELAESKISPSANSRSGKKRNKRKFVAESSEHTSPKSISEIKTSSGVFLEEPVEEKRKKENKSKNYEKEEILSTILLPTGLVYEQPLTPVHKKLVNGFEETRASPRPIGFKVKNILSAGQKEPPEYRKDSRGKRKLQLEDPTMVLPKPKWQNSGEFIVTKYPKPINQNESEATEFMVAPLKTKKSKSVTHVPLTVSSAALEFKKSTLYNKHIPRETSKQLLQRKEKQKFYKF